jgi:hypothetical protein
MITFPPAVGILAAKTLSTVDYTFATQVTHDVARIVEWSLLNDNVYIARTAISMLQTFDMFGGYLISLALWIMYHIT